MVLRDLCSSCNRSSQPSCLILCEVDGSKCATLCNTIFSHSTNMLFESPMCHHQPTGALCKEPHESKLRKARPINPRVKLQQLVEHSSTLCDHNPSDRANVLLKNLARHHQTTITLRKEPLEIRLGEPRPPGPRVELQKLVNHGFESPCRLVTSG